MIATARDCSALQLGTLIQEGKLNVKSITDELLAAIEACEDRAIFTCTTPDRARAEAEQSSRRIRAGKSLGMLDGVPLAWKDLFDLENVVTTAGSNVLRTCAPAVEDAAVVSRLKAAGMVSLGRVNMTEFAFSGLGLNPHYGTPHNPHGKDVPRIPGGSSSGSGTAVARGLVPISIGTDSGGSVRVPAAFNGVIGYKATRGRYPMDGVFPLAQSFDSLGVFCQNMADAVALDAALSGLVRPSMQPRSVTSLRLLVPTNVVFDDVEPGVMRAFEAALARLAAAGATIERRAIPQFDPILESTKGYGALVAAEAYALHEDRLNGPRSLEIDRRVARRAKLGSRISMVDYVRAMRARTQLIVEAQQTIDAGTLIAYPTVAHVAPPIAALAEDDNLFEMINAKTLRNTMLGNFLDWCGISIPCGTGDADMPVGFSLSALPGKDEMLLSSAHAAEEIIRGG
jgi:aspartyl-tRNA(Asn)/glutamyl-tRNA(Gln) amidotransferase subunit A